MKVARLYMLERKKTRTKVYHILPYGMFVCTHTAFLVAKAYRLIWP